MEKVQFQLEATLPELKDLYDKGLFSKHEIDQITKRRTAFETSLIRGQARKDDFFRYAEYEINLERLRKIRWKKLKYHINPPPPSASTYSLPRRALYILKRATAKFPGDLAVWLAYVEYAASQGMTKVVAKGLNSALQHHALSPTVYLLLSYHHLHPGAPLPRPSDAASSSSTPTPASSSGESFALEGTGPARTALLLGLRVLPASHELWTEYIKLELGWVEALRRRWKVLGVPLAADDAAEGAGAAEADELVGEGSFGPEGEDARRQILRGELVAHAVGGALEKVAADADAGLGFRAALLRTLRAYPSPLRARALAVVYDDLERIAGDAGSGRTGAHARLLLLTRPLHDRPYDPEVRDDGGVVLDGVEYVDAVGQVARAMRQRKGDAAWGEVAGEWVIERVKEHDAVPELRELFMSTLRALVKVSGYPLDLCRAHLALCPDDAALAAAYAQRHPTDAKLQLARIHAARTSGLPAADVRAVCAAAVAAVTREHLGEDERRAVEAVWLAWAAAETAREGAAADAAGDGWKAVLRASLRSGAAVPTLHPMLLARFFAAALARGVPVPAALRQAAAYHPTPRFFADAFGALDGHAGAAAEDADAAVFYTAWRAACRPPTEIVDAALTYAAWLYGRRRALEARRAVDTARAEAGDERDRLEAGWREIMDGAERRRVEEADGDEADESGSESGEGADESEGSEDGSDGADSDGDLQMF